MNGMDLIWDSAYNDGMKKRLKVDMVTTKEQTQALFETMGTFNEACNRISPHQMRLHHLVYFEAMERFPVLTSLLIRAIANLSDSYQTGKKLLHFQEASAMFSFALTQNDEYLFERSFCGICNCCLEEWLACLLGPDAPEPGGIDWGMGKVRKSI